MPASSSRRSVPCVVGAAACPNWWATKVEMPVVVGIRLGVARDKQRGGVDVAVLLDAQVELEVGPVRRQCVEDLLEFVGKRHDLPESYRWRTPSPSISTVCSAARAARRRRGGGGGAQRARRRASARPVLEELEREVPRGSRASKSANVSSVTTSSSTVPSAGSSRSRVPRPRTSSTAR